MTAYKAEAGYNQILLDEFIEIAKVNYGENNRKFIVWTEILDDIEEQFDLYFSYDNPIEFQKTPEFLEIKTAVLNALRKDVFGLPVLNIWRI